MSNEAWTHLRRWGHSVVALPSRRVCVFGGFGADPAVPRAESKAKPQQSKAPAQSTPALGDSRLNSIAEFDSAAGVWTRHVPMAGPAPCAREQHTAVLWNPLEPATPAVAVASADQKSTPATASAAAASDRQRDSSCRMIVYGGRTNPMNALSDVWSYQFGTKLWTQLRPAPAAAASTANARLVPLITAPALYRHSAIQSAADPNRIIVFGGRQTAAGASKADVKSAPAPTSTAAATNNNSSIVCTASNAVYVIELVPVRTSAAASGSGDSSDGEVCVRWFELVTSGDKPTARYGHAACAIGESMYVYGGFEAGGAYQQPSDPTLYRLNLATAEWSKCDVTASAASTPAPPPLYSHTLSVIGGSTAHPQLLLIGGACGYDALHHTQLYGFDVTTQRWYRPIISNASSNSSDGGGNSADAKSITAAASAFLPTALCVKHRTCVLPASAAGDSELVVIAGGGANCFSFGTTFNQTFAFNATVESTAERRQIRLTPRAPQLPTPPAAVSDGKDAAAAIPLATTKPALTLTPRQYHTTKKPKKRPFRPTDVGGTAGSTAVAPAVFADSPLDLPPLLS